MQNPPQPRVLNYENFFFLANTKKAHLSFVRCTLYNPRNSARGSPQTSRWLCLPSKPVFLGFRFLGLRAVRLDRPKRDERGILIQSNFLFNSI